MNIQKSARPYVFIDKLENVWARSNWDAYIIETLNAYINLFLNQCAHHVFSVF